MKSSKPVRSAKRVVLDPRLAIGLTLVIGSVAGVVALVSVADDTVQVYAAADSLVPGDRIDESDLLERSVRLDDIDGLYLTPGDLPDDGLVVSRSIAEGELVPVSATGATIGLRFTAVVLEVGGALSEAVQPTSLVDVWATRELENGEFGPPVAIVSGGTVVRLVQSESIVGGGQTTAIEVLVPRSKLARVLEATANGDAISIVPAGLPAR